MSAWAVIVAGGRGQRMGTETPKQLLKLGNETIIELTLKPFFNCPEIEGIVIAAGKDSSEHINNIISLYSTIPKQFALVKGGRERQDSVWNGLQAVPDSAEIVVIHDAVRPFIDGKIIAECVRLAHKHGAATVLRPLKETVKVVQNGFVVSTPDRSSLRITQTPQAFRKELILKAHIEARKENFTGTDDCMLVERLGHPVAIVEGNDLNIKITTPADLKIAGAILSLNK